MCLSELKRKKMNAGIISSKQMCFIHSEVDRYVYMYIKRKVYLPLKLEVMLLENTSSILTYNLAIQKEGKSI